jgi:hypothetical protein
VCVSSSCPSFPRKRNDLPFPPFLVNLTSPHLISYPSFGMNFFFLIRKAFRGDRLRPSETVRSPSLAQKMGENRGVLKIPPVPATRLDIPKSQPGKKKKRWKENWEGGEHQRKREYCSPSLLCSCPLCCALVLFATKKKKFF